MQHCVLECLEVEGLLDLRKYCPRALSYGHTLYDPFFNVPMMSRARGSRKALSLVTYLGSLESENPLEYLELGGPLNPCSNVFRTPPSNVLGMSGLGSPVGLFSNALWIPGCRRPYRTV